MPAFRGFAARLLAVSLMAAGAGCSSEAPPTAAAPAQNAPATSSPAPASASPSSSTPASVAAPAPNAEAPSAPVPPAPASVPEDPPPAPDQPQQSPEEALRAEVRKWRGVPYRDNGTTRQGIGNPEFTRAVVLAALGRKIPGEYDAQIRTGKLVERKVLAPGDLVFFEGSGFGPFKSKTVGISLGGTDVALATKDDGVAVVKLSDAKWNRSYKTSRRIPGDGGGAAPTFDVTKYRDNRAELLREIAKAWSGTLYRAGGKTFDGIGNDEFVREVYGAVYETDLPGDPARWAVMGRAVSRDALEPGDIIIYEADAVGPLIKQRHAGLYLGDGDFVAAVKGSAVTILELNDAKWRRVYKAARRIDPDALARAEEAAEPAPRTGAPATAASSTASPRVLTDAELRLRGVTDDWRGTPYKLGGTSKSGIDCSAFSRVMYKDVYQYELPRTAEEQERLGRSVNRNELQAGDLVFFRTQGMGPLFRSRHVGVYLGGGEFAQASGRHGVTISRLDNRYWSRKYHAARRLSPPAVHGD